MCPHCNAQARQTLAALAGAVQPAEYEHARATLRAALQADDEPAVRAWLVRHEPATMGRRNRPPREPRAQRQAARRAGQDERRAATAERRGARQQDRLERTQAQQAGRTERTTLRQERRTEAATGRAERQDVRQVAREERRALRGEGGGGIDASALQETAGNVVSRIRDFAGDIFGGGGGGGGGGSGGGGGGEAAEEENKKGSMLPIVLGLAAAGGLAYYVSQA